MGSLCCRRRSKDASSQGKTEDKNELCLENQKVNVFEIKRKLKQMKQDIESITITNCESDRERFESVDIILLREDLQVCDFPRLQHVAIDFVRKIKDDPASKELQLLDDKLYDKALQTIAKDVKTHLVLKSTVERKMLTINQQAFKDKRAFLYVMRKMKQLSCSLQRIVFQDIIILKKNIFFTFCQQMREIVQLEEIFIVNTNITEQQALQVQQLLRWKQKQIKVLVISGSNLSDCHLDILFFQKLKIEDLISLDRLELKNCPQLWKSTNYIVLMRQYAAIKLKQQKENELLEQEMSQANSNSKKDIILPQNQQGKQPILSQSPAPSQKNSNGTVSSEKKDKSQGNLILPDGMDAPKQPSISSIPSEEPSEAKYDNRHSRQLLIGQYLWEEENQLREERMLPLKGAINSQHFLGKPSEGKLIISADEGMGNVSTGGGQSSENQFFTQFLKSCFSELIDIDMCQVIDFSKFGYQNLNFEQKKQICSYIVDSNTIQVFAVQYDRLFFKELCEQISIKYKAKVKTYLKEQEYFMTKKKGEDFKDKLKNEYESISFGKFRSNLMSLESLKVIASKCEMFQFDSFCYLSFLSLFIISLEVDFQHQQIEDSIIFPSYEQILDYLKKMIKLEEQDNEDDCGEDEDFAENDEINVAEQIQEHFNSSQKEQTINLKQVNQETRQSNITNNNSNSKQNQIAKNIPKNNSSQFQEESYEIFNNIQWIQAMNSLQTTVQQLTLRNFSWQNVQNSSKEKSFSQFLFCYFSLTADSLMVVDFSDVDLSHSCLTRLHQILNRVFCLYNLAKQRDGDLAEVDQSEEIKSRDKESFSKRTSLSTKMEYKDSVEKLSSKSPSKQELVGQKGFPAFRRGSTRHFSGKMNKSKKIQNSIVEMNRNQMKSQHFLKRFRLKFSSEKILPIQNLLKIFAAMCKEVQISNASIGKMSTEKVKQSINNTANSTIALAKQGTKQQQQQQQLSVIESQELTYLPAGSQQFPQKNEKMNKLSNFKDQQQSNKPKKQQEIADLIDEQQPDKNNNNNAENNDNSKAVLGKISLFDYQGFSSNDIVLVNSQLQNLTELSLVRCSLSLPALVQIFQKITRFYNLLRLTISGNDLSKAVIQPLSSVLNPGMKDTSQIGNVISENTKDFSRLKTTMGQSIILPKIPKLRLITQKISLLLRIQQSFKSTTKPSSSSFIKNAKNQKEPSQQVTLEQQKAANEKKNSTEMLVYCVGKIFQLQKLQYLDLSSNNFSSEQGKLLLDEMQVRSEKLLQYRVQKQRHLAKRNIVEIENNNNNNDQQPDTRSGFYSKFIEKQLQSNRRQSTLYQNNSDLKKNFSKLNTKFFAGDENADQCIKEKANEDEEESLDSSFSSGVSEGEQEEKGEQQQSSERQGIKAKTFNLRRLEKQVQEQDEKEEEETKLEPRVENQSEEPPQKPQSDVAQEKDNSLNEPLPKESLHSLWKMKSKFFRGDQSDVTSNATNVPKAPNANAKPPKKQRIKKADIKYPEIQELYLQNNQLGVETTRDISKHLAIIFPRLKVLNMSAPKTQQKTNFEGMNDEEALNQKEKSVISFESTENTDRIQENQKISPQPNKQDNFERLILAAGVSSSFNELEKVILNELPWKIISAGRNSVFESLFNLTQIREIDLSGSVQDNQTAEYLCKSASMFSPCPLKKLSLRNCTGLSSKSWKTVVFCFIDRFQDLECLDLSGCNLSEKKVQSILEACSKMDKTLSLTQLILSNNPKLKSCLRTFILQLTQTFQLSLQLLDLSSCELNDESCESMIQGLLAGNKERIARLNQSLQTKQRDQNELKKNELLKKQATFALIKLLLFDNVISMKMMFLIQYCFVFQITEEDNILFNMQFASNTEQKQQLSKSLSQLKRQKGTIYSLLFGQKYEDFTIKATSLMLGENILSSKKKADDLLVSSLRTFREVKHLDIFVNDKVIASFNQFLTGNDSYNNSNANSNTHKATQSKSLQGGSTIKKSQKKTQKEEPLIIGAENYTKEEKDHVIGDENNNNNPNTQRVYESSNKQQDDNMFSLSSSRKHIKNLKKEQAAPSPQRIKPRISVKKSSPRTSAKDNNNTTESQKQLSLPIIFTYPAQDQELEIANTSSKSGNIVAPTIELQNLDAQKNNNKQLNPQDIILFDDSDEWEGSEEKEVIAKEGQELVQRIKVNDLFKQSKGMIAVTADIVSETNIKVLNPKNSEDPQVDSSLNGSILNNALVSTKSPNIPDKSLIMNLNQNQNNQEIEEDTHNMNPTFSGMDTRSLKQRSRNNPINLSSIESLTLKSHDSVGIISLLNFFSLVTSDLKKIDFSSITLSNTMFLKVVTTVQRLFPSLHQIKFANIHLSDLQEQTNFSQIANAIHSLLTNPQIHLISITTSAISEQLFQAIVDIQAASASSKFTVRSLDMSKNEHINFSDCPRLAILQKVDKLNLSSCSLNDRKFNLRMSTWQTTNHLSHLIDLDISDNKGLSPQFFQDLGVYISAYKIMKILNISHTAFYEDKQRKFSYGLNRQGLDSIQLEVLKVRGMTFSKQEGTLNLFKALAQLEKLHEVDFSEMDLNNNKEIDLFHNYLRYGHIAKLGKVKKMYMTDCYFLFEKVPFYNFESSFAFSEYNHCSMFLFSQFESLVDIDLSGCLNSRKLSHKFMQELEIMRRKRLLNYSIKKLNLSRNCIAASEVRTFVCNLLYIFKNLATLNIRSLVRFEQNYVQDLLDALDSYQYFAALQEYEILQKKNATANAEVLKSLLEALQQAKPTTANNSTSKGGFSQAISQENYRPSAAVDDHSNSNRQYDDSQFHNDNAITNENDKQTQKLDKKETEDSNHPFNQLIIDATREYQVLSLQEFSFSDISSDLINNKEVIDGFVRTCIANRNFNNLKEILIFEDYSTTANIFRLQSSYTESLLDLNEVISSSNEYQELNTQVRFGFQFKEAPSIIFLKTQTQKTEVIQDAKGIPENKIKPEIPSIAFNNNNPPKALDRSNTLLKKKNSYTQYKSIPSMFSQGNQTLQKQSSENDTPFSARKPQQQNSQLGFKLSSMRVEYLSLKLYKETLRERNEIARNPDENNDDNESMHSEIYENEDYYFTNNVPVKHKQMLVNQWNEHLFFSGSGGETDEHQIDLWRQFQHFTKRLYQSKIDRQTHISLDYTSSNLKLLSRQYNIFLDKKFPFNSQLAAIFRDLDSLYVGNALYHFLVQVCQFQPHKDLIDFLIEFFIFIAEASSSSFSSASELIAKDIRLPPFLILSETDARRIQRAFVKAKNIFTSQKKISKVAQSLFSQVKPRETNTQLAIQKDSNDMPQQSDYLRTSNPARNSKATALVLKVKQMIGNKSMTDNISPARQDNDAGNQANNAFRNMNKDSSSNKITCNYFYKSAKGCQEFDEIVKLKSMPPSTLDIEHFSVNGLKAVYMICYQNDYFIKGDISFDSLMFISTSLSFALREYFYKNAASETREPAKSFLFKCMYALADMFVDIDNYFKYDESINALDEVLANSTRTVLFFKFLIVCQLLIIFLLCPLLAFLHLGPLDKSGQSYIMHFIFGAYAGLSFIFEIFLLKRVIDLTRHLIPDLCLVHQNTFVSRISDFFLETFMNIEIFSYKNIIFFQQAIFSFLAQLDSYQDMSFIIIAFNNDENLIGILAVVIIFLNKSTELFFLFRAMRKNSYSNLFFQNINKLYEFAHLGALEGLSNLLDVISPHNVLRITDNFIVRMLLPKQAIGLTINKKIFNKITKVIYCDLPQIILQLLYSLKQFSSNASSVQLSIALNLISIIKSLLVILTIKQSVLNQMDFDELAEQKAGFLQTQFSEYQQKEIEMFQKINSNIQLLTSQPNSNIGSPKENIKSFFPMVASARPEDEEGAYFVRKN